MYLRNLMLTGLIFTLGACSPSGDEAQPSQTQDTRFTLPSSAVLVAKMQTVRPAFEFPGLTEAIQSTETRAMVSAEVKAIHFAPGQMVNQGDLLVEFDPADYQAQYAVAEAQVKTAKASATQARSNWERAKELKPDGYISEMQFDEIRAIYDTTRAAVASAEADLQRASLDLERTKVYAPFSGKISRPYYAVGTYVVSQSAVQPQPLFKLVQVDPIYVKGALELGAYNRAVLLRQRLASEGKEIPELVLTLGLAGNQEYPYSGTFESWDNTSVSSMGTITARLQFPNPDGLLLPGQNVLVKGESADAIDRIIVPQKAVQIDQQGHFVMIVTDGDVVQRRNIEVGIRVRDQWSVQQGLAEGERIIVDGLQTLREGMSLNIQDAG